MNQAPATLDSSTPDSTANPPSKRGFAAMDKAKQRRIASMGGHAAHEKGSAHQFTSDEARVAGRKGGEKVSADRAHMAAIGRRGGEARGQNFRTNASTGVIYISQKW